MPINKPQEEFISVEGARVHNLQNVSLRIPRGKLTVFTGLSGSGKSSLAFDTIYAEGQRRYVESLSSYARQFLGTLQKPDVDQISGLTPAISIDQRSASQSPRSTVGTMSEIYDYLRLLYTRVGKAHCPTCRQLLSVRPSAVTVTKKQTESKKPAKQLFCEACQLSYPELSLGSFSFNSPQGACGSCQGLGIRRVLNPELLLPNPRLTLAEGAIRPWSRLGNQGQSIQKMLDKIANQTPLDIHKPIGKFSETEIKELLYGIPVIFEGIIPHLEQRYRDTDSSYVRNELERYMVDEQCSTCFGQRLKQETLSVMVAGKSIADVSSLSVDDASKFFTNAIIETDTCMEQIIEPILRDVQARLGFLQEVGLGYLTLSRSADTLAGGEAQRIRLATQLGSGLTGILYVLDEPSIGLHPQNLDQLTKTMRSLRDFGNTVIVVEHDTQIINAADYIVDIGPGAGVDGGKIVAQGTPEEFRQQDSLTARYLRGDRSIEMPNQRRATDKYLTLSGVTSNNVQDLAVSIPLESFICVTGVSGSGKSTLVLDVLSRALAKHFHRSKQAVGEYKKLLGLEHLDKVISVDQTPIGRTPRSNPATYTNVFGPIRDLFAETPLAKERKYDAGHFSFNVRGGRCEACKGDGVIQYEMHFLPDVYVTCETCNGARYRTEVLDVQYQDHTIADVLSMTIREAYEFFKDTPAIASRLEVLVSVGLGYLELGQSATTLSGGEAQRIKLATDLARQSTGRTLYILDEPTTGLHFEDVRNLLNLLQALVDRGNTVLVIEHNLDMIKCADWVIDMGPGGGVAGGKIVAQGTPEQIAENATSLTGYYLKDVLDKHTLPRSKPAAKQIPARTRIETAV
jgi:excinuclease ABC subunit A